MKIGDLVKYNARAEVHRGIIVGGPKQVDTTVGPPTQWEVVWYDTSTKGWWNEEFLEVVSESW